MHSEGRTGVGDWRDRHELGRQQVSDALVSGSVCTLLFTNIFYRKHTIFTLEIKFF